MDSKEQYVSLMHVPAALAPVIQAQLKDAGITSRIAADTSDAFQATFGASPVVGNKVLVPESALREARELMGITDDTDTIEEKTHTDDTNTTPSLGTNPWVILAVILGMIATILFVF